MHSDNDISCYFIESDPSVSESVIDNDVIRCPGIEAYCGIFDKTIRSLQCFDLNVYDFIIRTNLSSLYIFSRLKDHLLKCPSTNYYAGAIGNISNVTYVSGSGMIMTPDVTKLLIDNHRIVYRPDLIGCFVDNDEYVIDDVAIGYVLSKHGIFPTKAPRCIIDSSELLKTRIQNTFHYRVKLENEPRDNEVGVKEELLRTILTKEDIINCDKYMESFPDAYFKTDVIRHRHEVIWREKNNIIHRPPQKLMKCLVTGHSDYSVTDTDADEFAPSIWWTTNKETTRSFVNTLPLGVSTPNINIYGDVSMMLDLLEEETLDYCKNLVLLNFNDDTHPDRSRIKEEFSNKLWVTMTAHDPTYEGRKSYLRNIRNHRFVLCPRGNGIDTHRLWETLYMGSIPIVQRHVTHDTIQDLPICFVNNWDEVTPMFLHHEYQRIKNSTWNLDKLKISYWIDAIRRSIQLPVDCDFIEIGTSNFESMIQDAHDTTVGFSIEPLKCYLNDLPDRKRVIKINAAITSNKRSNRIDIYYIPPDIIEKHNIPSYIKGCNKIGDYHPLHCDHKDLVKIESVPLINIDEFLVSNNIRKIKYLKIDTEGHDCVILKGLFDYLQTKHVDLYPLKIQFETNANTSSEIINSTIDRAITMGYIVLTRSHDTILELRKKIVFSYCLYGPRANRYLHGLSQNCKQINEIYPNAWIYVHVGNDFDHSILNELHKYNNVNIVNTNTSGIRNMCFRGFPIDDEDVSICFSRDADSCINARDQYCIEKFLQSDKTFQIIRDHPAHVTQILGGMWGIKRGLLKSIKLRELYQNFTFQNWNTDQCFLRECLYPRVKEDAMIFDEFIQYDGEHCDRIDVPTEVSDEGEREFVGRPVYLNMHIDTVVTATDSNPLYIDFIPMFVSAWSTLFPEVNIIILVVANDLPQKFEEYKKYIKLIPPVKDIHTAFQAQCVRLLYPGTITSGKYSDGVMITDIDMIPLNRRYYEHPIKNIPRYTFISYRDVLLPDELPMCYNIAVPGIWEKMFSGETLETIYSRSKYDGVPGGSGWSLDQIVLTEKFNKYSGAKCILNDRVTGYNRLCRSMNIQHMAIGSLLNDIRNGQYSDYHCLRPYEEYKDINQFIVNAISRSKRWNFVDKVVYINLDERTDRKQHMEDNTLNVFDRSKVHRFPAVKHERGNIGCTRSHIEVLKLAIRERWKNVLILEDDAQWNKYEEGYAKLHDLVQKPYDVILLSPSAAQWDPNTMRLIESETSCGYIVSSRYFVTLLKHYEEGLELLESTGNSNLYVMDEHWKSIQQRDLWYTIIPAMIYQRPGYSDIFYRDVDYRYRVCL